MKSTSCWIIAIAAAASLSWSTVLQSADSPYPPSTVIQGIDWAPTSEIIRRAVDSDTWPITWGDDDLQYTAFADGRGFEPKVESKLSLGFSKVTGPADGFSGENIRSNSGEQDGDGARGKKASGMLMVDGILYMWVRNADGNGSECQLAWSTDKAVTWTWSNWQFEEFGYCVFLNFGRNYEGSRDNYVYMYTNDDPSAYTAADNMVLTRVPRDKIADRESYEFFSGLDEANNPLWTSDVNQRGAVFSNAGRCLRSGISYNAGIGRYLWWQQIPSPDVDTRFKGGFGIYDAPEPWGPWTTAYYTEAWDVGPGETASFPTKWMSEDGTGVHLVFSGDDSFSVRAATLLVDGGTARPKPPTDVEVD
jgi:hypothetical protein